MVVYDLLLYVTVPVFTLFYWRGTWELCDLAFFPENLTYSAWCSLLVGYVGMLSFYLWQYVYHHNKYSVLIMEEGKEHLLYSLMSRCETYMVGFFVVNCWRGLWLLQLVYLLPADPLMSSIVSHVLGVVVLLAIRHFKSVFAPPALYMEDVYTSATLLNCIQRMHESKSTAIDLNASQKNHSSETTVDVISEVNAEAML
mmetsp:Transcript_2930/g.4442  ORF Transcript_2930/g.4442 Transcript_2930/m.4442 type:complete len:199 (-) Transcript_2930:92-688(-)